MEKTIYTAGEGENIFIKSMGKAFRLRAIALNDEAANEYTAKHDRTAVLACLGPLVFIANKDEGEGGEG